MGGHMRVLVNAFVYQLYPYHVYHYCLLHSTESWISVCRLSISKVRETLRLSFAFHTQTLQKEIQELVQCSMTVVLKCCFRWFGCDPCF